MVKCPRRLRQSVLCLGVIFGVASAAQAQATRTWVSGTGDDANPCSRTAPCKTFAGAISKTAAGGFIDALDPGGYGALTITKSITIDGGPGHAGILVAGTNGFVINAPGAIVTIRNLSFESLSSSSPGINGISVLDAAEVHIEKAQITGFSNEAVHFAPASGAEGYVDDATITNNAGGGVVVSNGRVAITNLRAESNGNGVMANGTAIVTVRDSYSAGGGAGFGAITATAAINLERCVSTHNQFGIYTAIGAVARLSDSLVISNLANGLFNDGSGSILSLSGNIVIANVNNGVFTSTTAKQ